MEMRLKFLKAIKEELEQDEIRFEDNLQTGTDCPAGRARQKAGLQHFPCKCPFDTRQGSDIYGCFRCCAIFKGEDGKCKVYSPTEMENYANQVKKLIE